MPNDQAVHWRECGRKRRYKTRAKAGAAIVRINQQGGAKDGISPRIYQCPHCGFLHIGHAPGSAAKIQDKWKSADARAKDL